MREGEDPIKMKWHRRMLKQMRLVAKELGLQPGTFDVRSNKGGPAVQGEVTLHGENVYVQIGGSIGILYRTCKGRKDYSGGRNNWADSSLIDQPNILASLIILMQANAARMAA